MKQEKMIQLYIDRIAVNKRLLTATAHDRLDPTLLASTAFSDIDIHGTDFWTLFYNIMQHKLPHYKFHNRPHKALIVAQYAYSLLHQKIPGGWIECGVAAGITSLLIQKIIKLHHKDFIGNGYFMVDSFEGVSEPTHEDAIIVLNPTGRDLTQKFCADRYISPLEIAEQTVRGEFPESTIIQGWIPDVLKQLPEQKWAFLHLDVDAYDPTYACLEYFYPRLSPGGIIACDDYTAPTWPGAMRAWNKYCDENNIPFLIFDNVHSVIQKPLTA